MKGGHTVAHLPGMSKKGFKVSCTSCTGNFQLTKSNLQTHKATDQEMMDHNLVIKPGVKYYKVHYYCKHCKQEYIVGFIDKFLKSDLGPRIKEALRVGKPKKAQFLAKQYKREMDIINKR